MERIMKAQTFADQEKQAYMVSKKTMEINPRHPLIREMSKRVVVDKADKQLKDSALLMFDAALLNSGFSIDHHQEFSERVRRVLSAGLNVDPDASMLGDEEFPVTEEDSKETEEDKSATSAESSDEKEL